MQNAPSLILNSVTMSSREIAELTGKQHAHVMRDIRIMLTALHGEEGVSNFGDTYTNPQNAQVYAIFNLPKDETICLMSGYDVKARMAIIKRLNELEGKSPVIADPQIAAMVLALQSIDAVKQQQEAQNKAIADHSARLADIEARNSAIIEQSGFYSVLAYANIKKIKLDIKTASALGRKAAAESKKHGVMTGQVPDPRYGIVKTYHSDILDIVFAIA